MASTDYTPLSKVTWIPQGLTTTPVGDNTYLAVTTGDTPLKSTAFNLLYNFDYINDPDLDLLVPLKNKSLTVSGAIQRFDSFHSVEPVSVRFGESLSQTSTVALNYSTELDLYTLNVTNMYLISSNYSTLPKEPILLTLTFKNPSTTNVVKTSSVEVIITYSSEADAAYITTPQGIYRGSTETNSFEFYKQSDIQNYLTIMDDIRLYDQDISDRRKDELIQNSTADVETVFWYGAPDIAEVNYISATGIAMEAATNVNWMVNNQYLKPDLYSLTKITIHLNFANGTPFVVQHKDDSGNVTASNVITKTIVITQAFTLDEVYGTSLNSQLSSLTSPERYLSDQLNIPFSQYKFLSQINAYYTDTSVTSASTVYPALLPALTDLVRTFVSFNVNVELLTVSNASLDYAEAIPMGPMNLTDYTNLSHFVTPSRITVDYNFNPEYTWNAGAVYNKFNQQVNFIPSDINTESKFNLIKSFYDTIFTDFSQTTQSAILNNTLSTTDSTVTVYALKSRSFRINPQINTFKFLATVTANPNVYVNDPTWDQEIIAVENLKEYVLDVSGQAQLGQYDGLDDGTLFLTRGYAAGFVENFPLYDANLTIQYFAIATYKGVVNAEQYVYLNMNSDNFTTQLLDSWNVHGTEAPSVEGPFNQIIYNKNGLYQVKYDVAQDPYLNPISQKLIIQTTNEAVTTFSATHNSTLKVHGNINDGYHLEKHLIAQGLVTIQYSNPLDSANSITTDDIQHYDLSANDTDDYKHFFNNVLVESIKLEVYPLNDANSAYIVDLPIPAHSTLSNYYQEVQGNWVPPEDPSGVQLLFTKAVIFTLATEDSDANEIVTRQEIRLENIDIQLDDATLYHTQQTLNIDYEPTYIDDVTNLINPTDPYVEYMYALKNQWWQSGLSVIYHSQYGLNYQLTNDGLDTALKLDLVSSVHSDKFIEFFATRVTADDLSYNIADLDSSVTLKFNKVYMHLAEDLVVNTSAQLLTPLPPYVQDIKIYRQADNTLVGNYTYAYALPPTTFKTGDINGPPDLLESWDIADYYFVVHAGTLITTSNSSYTTASFNDVELFELYPSKVNLNMSIIKRSIDFTVPLHNITQHERQLTETNEPEKFTFLTDDSNESTFIPVTFTKLESDPSITIDIEGYGPASLPYYHNNTFIVKGTVSVSITSLFTNIYNTLSKNVYQDASGLIMDACGNFDVTEDAGDTQITLSNHYDLYTNDPSGNNGTTLVNTKLTSKQFTSAPLQLANNLYYTYSYRDFTQKFTFDPNGLRTNTATHEAINIDIPRDQAPRPVLDLVPEGVNLQVYAGGLYHLQPDWLSTTIGNTEIVAWTGDLSSNAQLHLPINNAGIFEHIDNIKVVRDVNLDDTAIANGVQTITTGIVAAYNPDVNGSDNVIVTITGDDLTAILADPSKINTTIAELQTVLFKSQITAILIDLKYTAPTPYINLEGATLVGADDQSNPYETSGLDDNADSTQELTQDLLVKYNTNNDDLNESETTIGPIVLNQSAPLGIDFVNWDICNNTFSIEITNDVTQESYAPVANDSKLAWNKLFTDSVMTINDSAAFTHLFGNTGSPQDITSAYDFLNNQSVGSEIYTKSYQNTRRVLSYLYTDSNTPSAATYFYDNLNDNVDFTNEFSYSGGKWSGSSSSTNEFNWGVEATLNQIRYGTYNPGIYYVVILMREGATFTQVPPSQPTIDLASNHSFTHSKVLGKTHYTEHVQILKVKVTSNVKLDTITWNPESLHNTPDSRFYVSGAEDSVLSEYVLVDNLYDQATEYFASNIFKTEGTLVNHTSITVNATSEYYPLYYSSSFVETRITPAAGTLTLSKSINDLQWNGSENYNQKDVLNMFSASFVRIGASAVPGTYTYDICFNSPLVYTSSGLDTKAEPNNLCETLNNYSVKRTFVLKVQDTNNPVLMIPAVVNSSLQMVSNSSASTISRDIHGNNFITSNQGGVLLYSDSNANYTPYMSESFSTLMKVASSKVVIRSVNWVEFDVNGNVTNLVNLYHHLTSTSEVLAGQLSTINVEYPVPNHELVNQASDSTGKLFVQYIGYANEGDDDFTSMTKTVIFDKSVNNTPHDIDNTTSGAGPTQTSTGLNSNSQSITNRFSMLIGGGV